MFGDTVEGRTVFNTEHVKGKGENCERAIVVGVELATFASACHSTTPGCV